jgi:putative ABC transport system substrate-binding protein
MKRREFIALLGGATAWSLDTYAQQPERVRRVGVLMGGAEDDPEFEARLAAFRQVLEKLGWADGRTARIDYRLAAADPTLARKYAAELVGMHRTLSSPTAHWYCKRCMRRPPRYQSCSR